MPLMLNEMPLDRANRIFRYAVHQETVGTLVERITNLRQCHMSEDYFVFQQDLLERVLAVQKHRAALHDTSAL